MELLIMIPVIFIAGLIVGDILIAVDKKEKKTE